MSLEAQSLRGRVKPVPFGHATLCTCDFDFDKLLDVCNYTMPAWLLSFEIERAAAGPTRVLLGLGGLPQRSLNAEQWEAARLIADRHALCRDTIAWQSTTITADGRHAGLMTFVCRAHRTEVEHAL